MKTAPPGHPLTKLLLGIGMAAFAFLLFRIWGPAGLAGLIGFFGLFYIGSRLSLRRARRRLRETFSRLPEDERAAALAALNESERAELLAALGDDKR